MRTRCLGACVAAIFLVAARATTTVWVDDNDPGIEYRGDWIHNPISDPKDFNYGGSMTFTNVSGSTATSTDTATTFSLQASSATQPPTSILASGAVSPTSTAARAHSSKFPTGAIAGLAVAGLFVLVLIGLAGYRCRRRRQAQRQRDLYE